MEKIKDIKDESEAFARENRKQIARKLTNKSEYLPEIEPVSIFMAGSPGAGKTESSINLIRELGSENIIRIDTDELREYFDQYTGDNSHLFQFAATIIAEKIHDLAIKNQQSFIFDSTFHNFDKAVKNIERSLKRKRKVLILFIYQDPVQAWQFVLDREKKEGRRITKEVFIEKFCESQNTVNKIKSRFGSKIALDILIKNIDGSKKFYKENIDSIDNHIKEKYTVNKLMELL